MSTILTKNMIKDYLIFNSPCSVTELVNVIERNTSLPIPKIVVLEHLQTLEAAQVVQFEPTLGLYYVK